MNHPLFVATLFIFLLFLSPTQGEALSCYTARALQFPVAPRLTKTSPFIPLGITRRRPRPHLPPSFRPYTVVPRGFLPAPLLFSFISCSLFSVSRGLKRKQASPAQRRGGRDVSSGTSTLPSSRRTQFATRRRSSAPCQTGGEAARRDPLF